MGLVAIRLIGVGFKEHGKPLFYEVSIPGLVIAGLLWGWKDSSQTEEQATSFSRN